MFYMKTCSMKNKINVQIRLDVDIHSQAKAIMALKKMNWQELIDGQIKQFIKKEQLCIQKKR